MERSLFIVWQIGHMENTWGTQNQASDAGLVDADGEGLDANSVKTEQSGTEWVATHSTRQRLENPFVFHRFPNIFNLTWVFYGFSIVSHFFLLSNNIHLSSGPKSQGMQDLCCASAPAQSNGQRAVVGGKSTPSDLWKEHFQVRTLEVCRPYFESDEWSSGHRFWI